MAPEGQDPAGAGLAVKAGARDVFTDLIARGILYAQRHRPARCVFGIGNRVDHVIAE